MSRSTMCCGPMKVSARNLSISGRIRCGRGWWFVLRTIGGFGWLRLNNRAGRTLLSAAFELEVGLDFLPGNGGRRRAKGAIQTTQRPKQKQHQHQRQRQRTGVSAPHGQRKWRPPKGQGGPFKHPNAKSKSNTNTNGSGQECPLHTGKGKGQSDFSDWPLI